jgi:hypothetical protein
MYDQIRSGSCRGGRSPQAQIGSAPLWDASHPEKKGGASSLMLHAPPPPGAVLFRPSATASTPRHPPAGKTRRPAGRGPPDRRPYIGWMLMPLSVRRPVPQYNKLGMFQLSRTSTLRLHSAQGEGAQGRSFPLPSGYLTHSQQPKAKMTTKAGSVCRLFSRDQIIARTHGRRKQSGRFPPAPAHHDHFTAGNKACMNNGRANPTGVASITWQQQQRRVPALRIHKSYQSPNQNPECHASVKRKQRREQDLSPCLDARSSAGDTTWERMRCRYTSLSGNGPWPSTRASCYKFKVLTTVTSTSCQHQAHVAQDTVLSTIDTF